jgi:peptide/nickel transport system substrate-binding protein
MSELDYLMQQIVKGRINRREFMGRAAALGVGTALMTTMLGEAAKAETPKKGGTLKLGVAGGSTTDSMDITSWTDSVTLVCGFAMMNGLIENGPDNKPIPELAESYEAKPGAKEWVFNIRKGVTFHNGKTLDADDIIYSLNLHRGESKSGAAGPMKAITDIKKLTDSQIQITLDSGDADLPYVLSDYHLMIVPKDYKDWSKAMGTGAFAFDSFDPGVRASFKHNPNYWKPNRGYLDACEITVINDTNARMQALASGQVDVIHRVDPKTIALLKQSNKIKIVQAPGGWHSIISMFTDTAPFDNNEIRLALKYAIDRKKVLKNLFSGYGSVGNDQPIPKGDPFYNSELPQIAYDPDKARFHFKKAGLSDPKIVLSASDAAFGGAVDMATLFQNNASKAGIKIEVKKEPADAFWANVWLKAPFVTSYWGGRPAATQMFGVAYKSDAPWNDTHWKRPEFDKLLADARAELDEAKRREYIWAMQKSLHEEGGALIPAFRDWLDAHNVKVGGHTPHNGFDLDNGRICEKAWLKA